MVLKTHAQAKGIQFVRPIAKEDLVSAILQDQVTHLHQQLEAAKREVSQCSANTSSVASSLSSTPAVSAGTSSGMVGEDHSVVEGQLLVLPESQGRLSLFQLERPASSHEGNSGGGISGVGVGVNSSVVIGSAVSQREVKCVVDVGTQTQPCMGMSQSFDSLYTMQLPGQTDAVWRSEEALVCMTTEVYTLSVYHLTPNALCVCV